MSRHFAGKFQRQIIPRQWDACAYIPSLQMYYVHSKRKTKGNLDKNRLLKAISRDKQ